MGSQGKTVLRLWAAALLCVALGARADTPFALPMVTISLDDGWASQFTLARPALNKRALKSTYYLITDPLVSGWSGYMTTANAKTLLAEGNDLASHTVTHPHLPALSTAEAEHELADSQLWLQSTLSIPSVAGVASPYGEFNDAVLSQMRAHYRSHRTQVRGRVFNEDDPLLLRATYIRSTTPVADIKAMVDQTVLERGWLILTFHKFTTGTPTAEDEYRLADFTAVLDYLQARGVKVVTVSEGVAQLKSQTDADPKRFVYGDDLGNDVEDWSWGTFTYRNTSTVHDGKSAISLEPDNWAGLGLHFLKPVDTAVWSTLELWVNGGSGGGQKVELALRNGSKDLAVVPLEKLLGHTPRAGTWEKVTVSLPALGITSGLLGELYLEDTTGTNQPALFVDGIVLRKPASPAPPPPPPPPPPQDPPPPPPSTTPDSVLYDDALRGDWEDWSWGASDFAQPRVVHAGSAAISFEPDNWDGLYLHSQAGVDTSPYASVELWVNGGGSGGQQVALSLWDGDTRLGELNLATALGHPLKANTWEKVTIPLASVGGSKRLLHDLYLQDDSGADQGTVYFDDVRLVP